MVLISSPFFLGFVPLLTRITKCQTQFYIIVLFQIQSVQSIPKKIVIVRVEMLSQLSPKKVFGGHV
jgi:hypothetical protein